MSTTITLRPNATDIATGWTFGGGAATVHGALSDDVDGTYTMCPNNTSVAQIRFGTMTMPAGAQILSVGLRLRVQGTSAAAQYFIAAITFSGSAKTFFFTLGSDAPTSMTTFGANGAWLAKKTPDGGPWTLAEVNRIRLRIGAIGTIVHFAEAYIDVIYNEQPVVSAVTPTGSITTAQPTIGWTYTDPDFDAEDRWIARVFDDPLPAGFNPETSPVRVDSGKAYVGAAGATSWPLPKALPPGVYDVYVKASDAGSNGRYSQWASSKFTVSGSPPAPPKLVSAVADTANGRNVVTVEQTDNLLSQADFGGEELTGGYLRWVAGTNIGAPAVVAGTGVGGSAGIRATVTGAGSATTQNTLPRNDIVGGRQYATSGQVKASAATGTAHLDADWYDTFNTFISTSAGSSVTLSTGYQKSSVVANAPANAIYAVLVWRGASLAAGEQLTWDQCQIREASSATDEYRGGLDSRNLVAPSDSTRQASGNGGWVLTGTGTLTTVADGTFAQDGWRWEVQPGSVGAARLLKGADILLPVPAGTYQFYFLAWVSNGSGLTIDTYLVFTDDNGQVVDAPVYGGHVTLTSFIAGDQAITAVAPQGATKAHLEITPAGEANTTDRWTFDRFNFQRVPAGTTAPQGWRAPSGVDTYALVEYSDDTGTTWAALRGTTSSSYNSVTKQAVVYDYEALPNTSRMYRARTGVEDFQIDPVNGAPLSSAPSSTGSVTLPVTDFWLIDPYTGTRIGGPLLGDVQFISPEPQGVFEPLGRKYPVITSDVAKSERFTLRLGFTTAAAYDAFEAMRGTQHVLYLQSPSTRAWYIKLGDGRATTWHMGTPKLPGGGLFTVDVPAYEVGRPD